MTTKNKFSEDNFNATIGKTVLCDGFLIPMTDFVLQQDITDIKQRDSIVKYAHFLKQPLTLGMFVPCDLYGNVLEEKKPFQDKYYEYQEAIERCLFEGFEMDNSFVTHKSHNSFFYPISCLHEQTIEGLVKYNLELTTTAQKEIFG